MAIPALLVGLTVALRLAWVALVPTVPRGDQEMYLAAAAHLAGHGALPPGFVYMPGWVGILATVQRAGGGLLAAKLVGVAFAGGGAAATYALVAPLAGRRTAAIATALYALWPAGVALSSVLGTDVPFAAILCGALVVLVRGTDRWPLRGSLACGLLLGAAAYLRVVALPLAAVIGLCWWLPRCPSWVAFGRTALVVGACLLALLPWALRNRAVDGHLSFADRHGGATALLGSYPNTDGAYAPAALELVTHLTGAPFYARPHPVRDRAAYAVAGILRAQQPLFAAALMAAHAERLLAPDEGVLCWSVTCPGVLPPETAARLAPHRGTITAVANAAYCFVAAAALIGFLMALRERTAMALLLGAPAAALAALYTTYFGTARHHVTLVVLILPLAALTLRRLASADTVALRRLARAGLGALLLVLLGRTVAQAAAEVRDRHRWAVLACHADGIPRLCAFRRADTGPAPSPIVGGPGRVDRREGALQLEVLGAPLAASRYQVEVTLDGGAVVRLSVDHRGGAFVQTLPPDPVPLSILAVTVQRSP
jgi:4-amino-4-deoxy-L-arabinose transferase-like glycosyltransferase